MQVKLGCQPLTWGGDFEKAAREIAEIGYDGVEAPVANYLDKLDALKVLLERHNLQCCSTYCGGSFEDENKRGELTERIVKIAAALPQLGCDRIVLAAGPRPAGEISDELYERFADGVNECARQCYEKFGVKSVFHNHAWTLIEAPREVDLLMELTDPHFVLAGFDTAQLAYGGYEPVEAFEKWKSRIGYVHIKDNNAALPTSMPIPEKNALRDQHNAKKTKKKFHVFCELGQGALGDAGLEKVLSTLREMDYRGWITGELDSTNQTPRVGNEHNYRWLTARLKKNERAR